VCDLKVVAIHGKPAKAGSTRRDQQGLRTTKANEDLIHVVHPAEARATAAVDRTPRINDKGRLRTCSN
jgi:hypothetical protein